MSVRTVAALYVDKLGPYFSIPYVDCYDVLRDAKKYEGSHPVVAHPPCGPWGRMKGLSTVQDRTCGPHAVEMVQKYGGVLEHPADSSLFDYCRLPKPGNGSEGSGKTYAIRQVAWGHKTAKPTWLYMFGVPHHLVLGSLRKGGIPTHIITNNERSKLPRCTVLEARHTPISLAYTLVYLARMSEV